MEVRAARPAGGLARHRVSTKDPSLLGAIVGVTIADLNAANPRLVPLIAHDRAGFGGGLVSAGLTVAACALFATPSRSLWQALAGAGVAGFGAAIGVHPVVGYTDLLHLAPAIAGSALFVVGLALAASIAPGPRLRRDPASRHALAGRCDGRHRAAAPASVTRTLR